MSVSILYYKVSQERISSPQLSAQIADWVEELPEIKRQQILRLRQPKDQLLSLAGLQLLKLGISELTGLPFSLNQLQFPDKAKPYFDSNIDFNISHSGDVVCCVISEQFKVGIDVELHRQVTPATMNKFLNDAAIPLNEDSAKNRQQQFFDIWTKNEAIIKAANFGSIFNMHDLKYQQDGAYYQDQFWYTYPVEILCADENKEYTCHIACSEKISNSADKKIKAQYVSQL